MGMTNRPQPGDTVRAVGIGTRRPVEYVVLGYITDDVLSVARPSRKHPGDFFGGIKGLPIEFIEEHR